jgi:hypothetical protein
MKSYLLLLVRYIFICNALPINRLLRCLDHLNTKSNFRQQLFSVTCQSLKVSYSELSTPRVFPNLWVLFIRNASLIFPDLMFSDNEELIKLILIVVYRMSEIPRFAEILQSSGGTRNFQEISSTFSRSLTHHTSRSQERTNPRNSNLNSR